MKKMEDETKKFVHSWANKKRKRDDGKIHGGSKLGPPKDREPSPCLSCKEVRKDACIGPCHKLMKWMERVFGNE